MLRIEELLIHYFKEQMYLELIYTYVYCLSGKLFYF